MCYPLEKLLKAAGLILIIAVTACHVSQVYEQSPNTLYNNRHWIVSKTLLKRSVMGAYGFLGYSNSLSGNRLDLSKWHGFQEVIYRDKIDVAQIDFDYFLASNAYLTFIFNKNEHGFSGIRMSVADKFKSLYLTSNNDGKFMASHELRLLNVQLEKWNHCKVIFSEDGFSLFMNDVFIGEYKTEILKPQQIGFRGGKNTALVDNIYIRLNGSPRIIKEAFEHKDMGAYVIVFAVCLINLLAVLVLRVLRGESSRKIALKLIVLNVLLATIGSLYSMRLARYPKDEKFMDQELKIKSAAYWKGSGREFITKHIADQYLYEDTQNIFRILFIGSSQTRGAGASEESKTFVSRIEKSLNMRSNDRIHYECINAGISGVNSSVLLDLYIKQWVKLKPQIVVINLSVNDSKSPETFAVNLGKFTQINRSNGIKTIFVLEAYAQEHGNSTLRTHEAMKRVAVEQRVQVVDLHGCLAKNYDQGFLWWDFVHLTDFGQELAAECILGALKDSEQGAGP